MCMATKHIDIAPDVTIHLECELHEGHIFEHKATVNALVSFSWI